MRTLPWPARGLYLVTPETDAGRPLLPAVETVLPARPAMLQYRCKSGSPRRRLAEATALRALCARAGVLLIINDDVGLAARVDADGVHLGDGDADIGHARAALGRTAIIGASCYDDAGRARRAVAAGASYVAFGAFHASPSKATPRRADPGVLRATAALGVPRVAIGGITPENAPALVVAGADLVAVISGVFSAADPLAAAQAFTRIFQEPPA